MNKQTSADSDITLDNGIVDGRMFAAGHYQAGIRVEVQVSQRFHQPLPQTCQKARNRI